MQDRKGLFIAIEGSDGSGKATQVNLLSERLKAIGYDVLKLHFPQYTKDSSYFLKKYLKGDYGDVSEVSPYTSSLFYALDRYEAAKEINKALEAGKIVLADRYTGSNMAHQGSKFSSKVEQRGFFVWADNLEYQLLEIPRPDISLFLRVPASISVELMNEVQKSGAKKPDIHEVDSAHLKKTVSTFDLLCQLFPRDFKPINCTKNGELLSIADINNLIWQAFLPLLPKEKPNPSRSIVVSLDDSNDKLSDQSDATDELDYEFKNISELLKNSIEMTCPPSAENSKTIWNDFNYDFYTPQGLPREILAAYKQSLKRLAELHKQLGERLRVYTEKLPDTDQPIAKKQSETVLSMITPYGGLSDHRIIIKKSDVNPLAEKLLSDDNEEAQWAGKQLYLAARQKWPHEFNGALESDEDIQSVANIIAKLSDDAPLKKVDTDGIRLLELRPRQEFDLIADSVYASSNLPLDDIAEEISNWPYQQKHYSLANIISQPGSLDLVTYKLDLISDQIAANTILRLGKIKSAKFQLPSPLYGYNVPEIVEKAEADDLFLEAFDKSLKLYSLIQSSDRPDLSSYAALKGNKLRWQFSATAAQLRDIVTMPIDSFTQPYIDAIYEKLGEAHPQIWDIISGNSSSAKTTIKPSRNRVKPFKQRVSPKKPKTKN